MRDVYKRQGLECVQRILTEIGVTDVHVVEEQRLPDGRFPTCPYPNPEIREALTLGLRDCGVYHPDLLLATDPDVSKRQIRHHPSPGAARESQRA